MFVQMSKFTAFIALNLLSDFAVSSSKIALCFEKKLFPCPEVIGKKLITWFWTHSEFGKQVKKVSKIPQLIAKKLFAGIWSHSSNN